MQEKKRKQKISKLQHQLKMEEKARTVKRKIRERQLFGILFPHGLLYGPVGYFSDLLFWIAISLAAVVTLG